MATIWMIKAILIGSQQEMGNKLLDDGRNANHVIKYKQLQ
jgi:hypothetical protein